MALLSPMTRERLDPALHALWDECAKSYAAFENLWATMANSPTIFRHVWGQLLELKRDSPVAARHFEIGIVVVSALHRCHYCVSHHAPLARVAGLDAGQVAALAGLTRARSPRITTSRSGRASLPTTAWSWTGRTSWCGPASILTSCRCRRAPCTRSAVGSTRGSPTASPRARSRS